MQSMPRVNGVSAGFAVTGLTCGSCASLVSSAVGAIDHVADVRTDVVSGGISTVTVFSSQPIPAAAVRSAVERAGYQLINA